MKAEHGILDSYDEIDHTYLTEQEAKIVGLHMEGPPPRQPIFDAFEIAIITIIVIGCILLVVATVSNAGGWDDISTTGINEGNLYEYDDISTKRVNEGSFGQYDDISTEGINEGAIRRYDDISTSDINEGAYGKYDDISTPGINEGAIGKYDDISTPDVNEGLMR